MSVVYELFYMLWSNSRYFFNELVIMTQRGFLMELLDCISGWMIKN